MSQGPKDHPSVLTEAVRDPQESEKDASPPAKEEPADAAELSLTHLDASGRVMMVDVSAKPETDRRAVARGSVRMNPATASLISAGQVAKGSVLTVARVAGIMAAKRCAELIPLAHPLLATNIQVELEVMAESVEIEASVDTSWKTGVEMEALTAVSIAALTVYDMCKAVDKSMVIEAVRVVHKSGGKTPLHLPGLENAEGKVEPPGEIILDREALLENFAGDEDILAEVIPLFLALYPELLDRMHGALERSDGKELEDAAHSLKGSAGNLRAPAAFKAAGELETIGTQGDLTYAPQAVADLERKLESLKEALLNLVGSKE